MRRPSVLFAAAVGLLVVAPNVGTAGFAIDSFAITPAGGQIATDAIADAYPGMSLLSGLPVLGGSREIIVRKTGQIGVGKQPVKASVNELDTGTFNFDQYSSTANGVARLIYDGKADGLLTAKGFATGVDLTDGGANLGFKFQNLKVTGSGLSLTVNLFNRASGLVFSSGPQSLANDFMGELFLPYTSFTGVGGSGTASNVGAIEIIVDGSAGNASGSDMTFVLFSSGTPGPTPAPEPASIALLACGVLLTGGYGLRRRRTIDSAIL